MIHFRLLERSAGRWTLEVHAVHDEWIPLRHFSNKAEADRMLRAFVVIGELAEACDD